MCPPSQERGQCVHCLPDVSQATPKHIDDGSTHVAMHASAVRLPRCAIAYKVEAEPDAWVVVGGQICEPVDLPAFRERSGPMSISLFAGDAAGP